MRRIATCLATAMLLCFSIPAAHAKDLCAQDNFGDYWVFSGVKSFKPNKSVLLIGTYSFGVLNAPFVGVANPTGTAVNIGIQVHSMSPFSGLNISVTFVTDNSLNGGGFYDNSGDHASDGAINLTGVSCSSLPLVNSLTPPVSGPSVVSQAP